MKQEKIYIPFFCDWLDMVEDFSDEELGKLLRSLNRSVREGRKIDTGLNSRSKVAQAFMLDGMDRVIEARNRVSEVRSESAKKRWANANESFALQTDANDASNQIKSEQIKSDQIKSKTGARGAKQSANERCEGFDADEAFALALKRSYSKE